MEIGQITCDNLGMTRDMSISTLAKSQDGTSNYAFENHNIRIMAVNDNTKFSVTNEKSTKYEGTVVGKFIGGCTCGRYLVLFIKGNDADFIYRLEYTGTTVAIVELFKGNLNFNEANPIEAIGYYESEEIQKVYWVDGLNQNRFINIAKVPTPETSLYTVEYATETGVGTSQTYYMPETHPKVEKSDGDLYPLCKKDGTILYYSAGLSEGSDAWTAATVEASTGTTIASLGTKEATLSIVTSQYNNYSFDFQGRINYIPEVTITKNYEKAGTFQAGVIQYFMTYYNKYGIETCLAWSSDLQYLSLPNRGGKADEAVSCGFDFVISNIEEGYDFLRIYSCYRSGINGVVSSKIIADISLANVSRDTELRFTDLGSLGTNFNSDDMPYIGGQDIRANTLDYKQDTLFLGDIKVAAASDNLNFHRYSVDITEAGNFDSATPVEIQEGGSAAAPFLIWSYKFVSPLATKGVYHYDQEIRESQEEIAGFKWREVYRFGIQFMDHEGTWTPAYWLGDKMCDLKPRTFEEADIYVNEIERISPDVDVELTGRASDDAIITYHALTTPEGGVEESEPEPVKTPLPVDARFGDVLKTEYYNNTTGERVYEEELDLYDPSTYTAKTVRFHYKQDGCYMANIMVDIDAVMADIPYATKNKMSETEFREKYVAYRLLVVDTDVTNRRIVAQGVINPTMFNYTDRYYNQPFSIPSWIFRPRGSAITNKHYDTLPIQSEKNAELQGIVERRLPGFKGAEGKDYNSYLFIVASNEGTIWSGYIQWKLIYYNSGNTDLEKAERLYLFLYTGSFEEGVDPEAEYDKVAELMIKHNIRCIKPNDDGGPGHGVIELNDSDSEKAFTSENIISYLRRGYIPIYIYGTNYRVISSWIYDYGKLETLSYWSTLRNVLVNKITEDMKATTKEQVGEELAGHIVLSPAMLPSRGNIKDIARAGSGATEIAMAIMAAIVAAAAIVLSVLSAGILAAPLAMGAIAACGAAAAACACGAVGAAAAAATLDIQRQDMSDLCKEMLAMGYYPVGGSSTSLSARKSRSRHIGLLLDRHFKPEGYTFNGRSGASIYRYWDVPLLIDDNDGERNRYPFVTGAAYTKSGSIGMDYNAFAIGGKLSCLDAGEIDLKKKQNVFCVDESIVTLNAPDIEENFHAINQSEALRLDLVGMIPIDAAYGMYSLSTESGLNSLSQVIRGRFKSSTIEEPSSEDYGILNADIYQDFKPTDEAQFDSNDNAGVDPIQVTENVDAYRVFMWNRSTSAGFWFPGITLKNPIDSSDILEPRGKILNKQFANLRYSIKSVFFPPKKMNIESPTVCLDTEQMLKVFQFNDGDKNYYESVDTISINNTYYPLLCSGNSYPSSLERITNGALKDPISIRYKETAHVLLPLSWDNATNSATILPYLEIEGEHKPSDMYDVKTLNGISLYGVANDAPNIGETYIYVKAYGYNGTGVTDLWGVETANRMHRILTSKEILNLSDLMYSDIHTPSPGNTLEEILSDPFLYVYHQGRTLKGAVKAICEARGSTYEHDIDDILQKRIPLYIDSECTVKTVNVTGKPGSRLDHDNISALDYIVQNCVLDGVCLHDMYDSINSDVPWITSSTKKYLLQAGPQTFYVIAFDPSLKGWTSAKVETIPANSKIVVLTPQEEDTVDTIFTRYYSNSKEVVVPTSSSDQDSTPTTITKYYIFPGGTYEYQPVNTTGVPIAWNCMRASLIKIDSAGEMKIPSMSPNYYFNLLKKKDESNNDAIYVDYDNSILQDTLEVGTYVKVANQSIYCRNSEIATIEFDRGSGKIIGGKNKKGDDVDFKLNNESKSAFTLCEADDVLMCTSKASTATGEELLIFENKPDIKLVIRNIFFAAKNIMYLEKNIDGKIVKYKGAVSLTQVINSVTGQSQVPSGVFDFENIVLDTLPIEGTWKQDQLTWRTKIDKSYLFIGELIKKDFDYNTWNGGTSQSALQKLTWNVASKPTPLSDVTKLAWGDTYYQRWDCEKTFPYTEDDPNSNIEILSCMLESHVNLDGRCDLNRGTGNLINTRPHNTMYNDVYSQKDNFFTYQVLDDKFSKSHFESDVVWSLTKNNMDDIDRWTCLLAVNEMSLDGRYGAVRKILNVNDVLISFQDTGIANIRYNETAALNTTAGLPLQMGNTGKVDGYRMISDSIGCHNKFSINKNSAGVFFADDFGKSFNQFTSNGGIADISMRANFSAWFKKNLNGKIWNADTRDNFRTSYDEVTHDLYIVKNDVCVVYNTLLQKFTTFMDYIDTPIITRLISENGASDTFALHSIRRGISGVVKEVVDIWKMFAGVSTSVPFGLQGAYGYIYGEFKPYSMEYRLNPDPLHDSIFTNYQYTADWFDPSKNVDDTNIFGEGVTAAAVAAKAARRYTSFDTVEAKNEYQQGIMNITPKVNGFNRAIGRQPLKSMFRVWRGDIPRDGDTLVGHTPLSDRMRNPWIHLKFTKVNADDSKMVFHNLSVNYYNQYGRI